MAQSSTQAKLASTALAVSYREAARLLGIDRGSTLSALVARGVVRSVPWGKRSRIPLAEVERLASEGFTLPPKPAARAGGRGARRADSEALRTLDLDALVVPARGTP